MSDQLERARASYERRAWSEAYHAFVRASQSAPLPPDDLERLATSSYLIGRDLEFERFLERLHRAHVDGGQRERAARCAFWLGLNLLFRGQAAQSNAWVARAQRLVDCQDCVERGYLMLPVAEQHLRADESDAAHSIAAAAVAIGERFADPDLVACARHVQGRALIHQGHVRAGLGLLDEVMLGVTSGELSPMVTGLMYCSVIATCGEVYAWNRAREWTFALSRWCEEQSEMVAFSGTCLVHRAEIMQFHGSWADALTEACLACERSRRADRKPPAAAFYRQAEIHRLRGEYAEAEAAYHAASRQGSDPQPGLALLRLAQGRSDAAGAAISRLVSATTDRLQRARLLPAHLEIMLARGDLEEARQACVEVQELATLLDTEILHATAVHAQGAIALAEGDARAALGPLRRAFDLWQRVEAPYESARARVDIARACRALGDDEATALELAAARVTFEQLGARPELERLDRLAGDEASSAAHPLTAREREVLCLVAAGHTNKEIAARLCLSERTIDRHVGNILCKLDVSTRTAATAYAYDHKLL